MIRLLPVLLAAALAFAADAPPRTEYPQPQFQREQWLSLNGSWQFEFDDRNAGLDENWAAGERSFSRTILVPFCFESAKSGIGDTSFHPWIWYRRAFSVPPAWKGRRVLLNFGAVDYRAMVWVNGRLAGSHTGGNVPFRFDVTPLLKEGANTLAVRAEDPPTDRSVPRGKQYWQPKSSGIFYTRTSGIWQPVWIEAAGESWLDSVRVTPTLDGAVRFEARIARAQPDLEFTASVRSGRKELARTTALAAHGRASNHGCYSADGGARTTALAAHGRAVAGAVIADPSWWSPASPNLYDVVFELRRGGTVLDRVTSYFGFRSVGVENGRFTLNGRPLFLKMVLDQGYWPDGILTPPSDEAIQYDIRLTKEMGFNGARKHQKVEDPRFLYWADKMGLLVSAEMANAYVFNEDYAARFTAEWIEAVERDYNHPSVVIWAPINESWGVPWLRDPRQQNHLKSLYTLTRSLDATRLVIDNEGWEHTGMTDLFAIHDYARTGDLLLDKYKDLGKPPSPVPDVSRASLIPGYKYNGAPFYLSEFGGIAFILPGTTVPREAWGYSGIEKTETAALDRMEGLWRAIAKVPAWAGLCYTQLTDVEQEINGLLTYDRKPKFDVKQIRRINETVR